MEATRGRTTAGLIARLEADATRFEFFQAVRLLERLAPESQVGTSTPCDHECVRFASEVSLSFPSSPVARVERAGSDESLGFRMEVRFFSLLGASGVMPHHYTVMAIERRSRERDTGLASFLDLFNHRLLSLFYRAWSRSRLAASHESPQGQDLFREMLLSLIGLQGRAYERRGVVSEEALLAYAGLLADHKRRAFSLETMLSDYLGVAAQLIQFDGKLVDVPAEWRTRLGVQNARLGADCVAGSRVVDAAGRFRVRLGPVDLQRYLRLITEGDMLAEASHIISLFAGAQFEFEIQPILRAADVPAWQLGNPTFKPRLGRSIWLRSTQRPFPRDFDQARFIGSR
jgi:type VI secretion system protein ImpH